MYLNGKTMFILADAREKEEEPLLLGAKVISPGLSNEGALQCFGWEEEGPLTRQNKAGHKAGI